MVAWGMDAWGMDAWGMDAWGMDASAENRQRLAIGDRKRTT